MFLVAVFFFSEGKKTQIGIDRLGFEIWVAGLCLVGSGEMRILLRLRFELIGVV